MIKLLAFLPTVVALGGLYYWIRKSETKNAVYGTTDFSGADDRNIEIHPLSHESQTDQTISEDLTPPEKQVFEQLRQLQHNSIWGIAISNVCEVPDVTRFRELIKSLKSQYNDNPEVMTSILGEVTPKVIAL